MKKFLITVLLLMLTTGSFAGPLIGWIPVSPQLSDEFNLAATKKPNDTHPTPDNAIIPPARVDLPKEVTLAEAPAQDCCVDGVIFRNILHILSWRPFAK